MFRKNSYQAKETEFPTFFSLSLELQLQSVIEPHFYLINLYDNGSRFISDTVVISLETQFISNFVCEVNIGIECKIHIFWAIPSLRAKPVESAHQSLNTCMLT